MKTDTIVVTMITAMFLLVLPASASDFTLGVFGNANEDETINMQDVTYTELIILEYKEATELADAKYDSEIDILDVTQIELIILGREKELTLIDSTDRIVTVKKPVKRIIAGHVCTAEAIPLLGAWDRVVGRDPFTTDEILFPGASELPVIRASSNDARDIYYETVFELEPDIFLMLPFAYVDWSDAVKGRRVYLYQNEMVASPRVIVALAYQAKWFHPDLFKDLDCQAIHQQYLTDFVGIDYDLDEHGVLFYPEP